MQVRHPLSTPFSLVSSALVASDRLAQGKTWALALRSLRYSKSHRNQDPDAMYRNTPKSQLRPEPRALVAPSGILQL